MYGLDYYSAKNSLNVQHSKEEHADKGPVLLLQTGASHLVMSDLCTTL